MTEREQYTPGPASPAQVMHRQVGRVKDHLDGRAPALQPTLLYGMPRTRRTVRLSASSARINTMTFGLTDDANHALEEGAPSLPAKR